MFKIQNQSVAQGLYYLLALWQHSSAPFHQPQIREVPMPPAIPLEPRIARRHETRSLIMSLGIQEHSRLIEQLLKNHELVTDLIDAKSQILQFAKDPHDPINQAGIQKAAATLGLYINTIVPQLSQEPVGSEEVTEAMENCCRFLLDPFKSSLNMYTMLQVLQDTIMPHASIIRRRNMQRYGCRLYFLISLQSYLVYA